MVLERELTTLNPQQKKAVMHINGPMLVLAGAGSGKTKVATLRMAYLIASGIPSGAILGLTFTNKAAHEMKERVARYAGKSVLVSTFHSLGARILRESIEHLGYTKDFAIYDESDSEKVLKEVARELGIPKEVDLKQVRSAISAVKNNLQMPAAKDALLTNVFERYSAKLKACNAVDFDDLLYLPTTLFRDVPDCLAYYQQRWQYICVDEYQDTNVAQYSFVKLLGGSKCNLFVVGDPDQSIYSWRGANINNILNFEKDFSGATVVRLEQNYRSTSIILQAANAVIKNNEGRYEKSLWSALGDGEKISFFAAPTERQEAGFVSREIQKHIATRKVDYNEIAIFYRTNVQSRVLEDELMAKRIPYHIVGGTSFYQRREIKDVLSMLRLIDNPKDVIAFLRVINLPKRGLGETTLIKLTDAHKESELSIMDFLLSLYREENWSSLPFTVTSRQKEGIKDFAVTYLKLQSLAQNDTLEELVRTFIFEMRYLETLDDDPESKAERLENLEELIVKAAEWESANDEPTLSKFLEELALVSAHDVATDDTPSVSLMTLHNGKGLEFRLTFLVGLEEDLLPHINSKKSEEQVEEERRLFYVGITRAKEMLYISLAQSRSLWGAVRRMRPSRFLQEVPPHLRKIVSMNPVATERPSSFSAVESHSVPAQSEPFEKGDLVMHAQFGIGKIMGLHDSSLGLTYDVYFTKDNSTKRLVAKYAPLVSVGK
jgi:DNA helicase-2/ATP-dependent DNA helicase PcrA